MKITVKNLQQQTFTVDIQPEKSVLQLKEQIFKERGTEYLVAKQKLIYAGVILDDDRTIASYNVDEKKFIVVMLQRDFSGGTQKSTQPAPTESRSSSIIPSVRKDDSTSGPAIILGEQKSDNKGETHPDNNEVEETVKQLETKESASVETKTPPIVATESTEISAVVENIEASQGSTEMAGAGSLQSRAESNLLMGDEYNRTVGSMVEMGYSREMVERAMAASFNNPERAVEYLISGIPDNENGFNSSAAPVATAPIGNILDTARETVRSTSGERTTENTNRNATAEDPFAFLRNQPQFLQMRQLVYQNPDLLHAVLQQIGQTNPSLLQLISENQDAFLNMLNQPLEGESGTEGNGERRTNTTQRASAGGGDHPGLRAETRNNERSAAATAATLSSAALGQQRNVEMPPEGSGRDSGDEVIPIPLTPQDRDAIERLKALGFPEALVVQAYFACEKNEELAANFLITSAFDD